MASIEEYRNYVLGRKFTQNPSHYSLTIGSGKTRGGGQTVVYKCYPDSVLLAGRNFINTPFAYFGPEFTVPLRREYNELSVNFIVFQDWADRTYFEDWMDAVIPHHATDPGMQMSDIFPSDFLERLRNIELTYTQRSSQGGNFPNAINFKFFDSYPLLITPTSFSSDNSGYTIFTVNFAYKYYEYRSNISGRGTSITL